MFGERESLSCSHKAFATKLAAKWTDGRSGGGQNVMSLFDDDFEKRRRELVFEQVSKAIKENPKNWASKILFTKIPPIIISM